MTKNAHRPLPPGNIAIPCTGQMWSRLIKGYGQNEDWNFCVRAKRAGLDVVCATDVFADHLGGVQPLSLDFVRTWKATHSAGAMTR